jgi:hypothetical protein
VKQLTMSRLGHHIKGHPSKARFSKSRGAARRPATEGERRVSLKPNLELRCTCLTMT